jgi:hypothetical protein
MSDDWKFYSQEPEYKAARVAENDYHTFRRELMLHGASPSQQTTLEEKKRALLSAKAAVADLVDLNPCMNQFLDRYPRYLRH